MRNKHFYGMAISMLWALHGHAYETPTMGWSSWNTYGIQISETLIKAQADAMVGTGLKDAGYKYINIDDGYFGGRDSEGKLLIHPTRFPNGLAPIVEYIHEKGLKAGIYSDAGKNTCASYWGGDEAGIGVGLYGHDTEDINYFFKELDFDFIKVDFCGGQPGHNVDNLDLDEKERYTAIHEAIVATGREDVRLNVCRWAFPGTWVHDVATSWRISEDIYLGWASIKSIVGQNLYLSAYATEGKFNDMDMLEVGRGLTTEEDKTHFGMWCIMSSPLLIGCDMTSISQTALELLKNKDLIAINQDPLAQQAYVVKKVSGAYILAKDIETLYGKRRAVAFYNPTDQSLDLSVDFLELDLGGTVQVRDAFEQQDLGTYKGTLETNVPAHGTRIYIVEAEERYERSVYEGETAWLSAYQELTNNQSSETGIYEEADYCSGGAKAGWLGKSAGNDLQWRNVFSEEGGEYTMTLTFISGADRNVTITVNGGDEQTFTLNSGGWSNPAQKEIKITLQKGNNVIRLYNASDWMPDIDRMTLEKDGSLDSYKHLLTSLVDKAETLHDTDLPVLIRQSLADAIEQARNTEETKESYQTNIDNLQTVIEACRKSMVAYTAFDELKRKCQEIADHTEPGNALEAFLAQITEASSQVDAATQSSEIEGTTSALKEKAIAFLKSEDAWPVYGQSWDMTMLLTNPDFTSDATGWSGSPVCRYGVAEHYNKNFDTYQTLTGLKNGNYTVEVNALYRTQENDGGESYKNGSEDIPAVLYANEQTQKIASLYSYLYDAEAGSLGSSDLKNGYANSMYAASQCFAMNQYHNSVEAVVTDGTLKTGLKSQGHIYDCWCCFDNFRLSYSMTRGDAIKEIPSDVQHVDVYTVSGVMVRNRVKPSEALKGLAKGIYIIDGKKVVNP